MIGGLYSACARCDASGFCRINCRLEVIASRTRAMTTFFKRVWLPAFPPSWLRPKIARSVPAIGAIPAPLHFHQAASGTLVISTILAEGSSTTLPRSGSRVRIPSPAPVFSQLNRCFLIFAAPRRLRSACYRKHTGSIRIDFEWGKAPAGLLRLTSRTPGWPPFKNSMLKRSRPS